MKLEERLIYLFFLNIITYFFGFVYWYIKYILMYRIRARHTYTRTHPQIRGTAASTANAIIQATALCHDRCETMSEGGEDSAVYTRKFSNFAQIISRQGERAKMKLAVVSCGVSQLSLPREIYNGESYCANLRAINERKSRRDHSAPWKCI